MRPKLLAEFLGTFALVFAGTGAMVVNDLYGGVITHVGVSMVWGLVVMAMIYAVGEISGAHFNPAVTIGFAFSGSFPWRQVGPYVLAQLAGATAASGAVAAVFGTATGLGITQPHAPATATSAFGLELALTFFLMLVILSVARGSKEQGLMAGIAIGATIGLEAMFAGPVTNASMNPARSVGPAMVSGNWNHLWLFIAAPIVGAALAVPVWKAMRIEPGLLEPRSAS